MKTLILTESKFFSLIRESVLEALACLGASYNNVRRLAHDVKTGDSDAIEQAAILMSRKVPANSILIPVPNHSGKADYTLRMAKRIAQLSKSEVLDIIKATPREGTLYTTKIKNKGIAKEQNLGFSVLKSNTVSEKLKNTRNVILIDNVVDSGMTYQQAEERVREAYGVKPWMLSLGAVENPKDTSRDIIRSVF